MTEEHTIPDHDTEGAEQDEAHADHVADRPPTADEEEAAERTAPDPAVAEHYREAIRTGAEIEGEGEVS
jgi:hypothetical protein